MQQEFQDAGRTTLEVKEEGNLIRVPIDDHTGFHYAYNTWSLFQIYADGTMNLADSTKHVERIVYENEDDDNDEAGEGDDSN